MRFYILPKVEDKTTCINFDHVTRISVSGQSIELYFIGTETPVVIPKTVGNLSSISKGMDLSDTSREQVCSL